MTVTVVWWLVLVTAAVVLAVAAPAVLRRLPRTAGAPDYPALAGPRFCVVVAAVGVVTASLVAWRAEHPVAWCAVVAPGALQVAVDARTTWLPLRLSQAMWALAAGAVAWLAVVDPDAALRGALGAGAVTAGFWLVWRLGGIGFGDVRLVPVLGLAAATQSWSHVLWAVLAGTMLGAVHGIVHRLRGHRGAFPYGPSLWVGAVAVLLMG